MSKLTCGGKGPCCHVGYSHRHCEHCDMVIATYNYYWNPIYPPYRLYQPYGGTFSSTSNVGFQLQQSQLQNMLAGATAEHECSAA